jgi:hypothetical protein
MLRRFIVLGILLVGVIILARFFPHFSFGGNSLIGNAIQGTVK